MKKNISTLALIFISTLTFSQNSDWSKTDRNNIFEECMSVTSKYNNITKEQKESLSLCFLEEITKQFSKKEYQSKIDIEINRIQQATISLCAKNIGVNIESTQKTEKEKSKLNEGNFSRKDLIGVWQDESCKIYLNEDATYLVKWDNGKSASGKWWINEVKDIIFENLSRLRITSISADEFKFEQVTVTKTNFWGTVKATKTNSYTATRVE
jgi:hypothetical protein